MSFIPEGRGCHQEFVVVPDDGVGEVPAAVSMTDAAVIPMSGLTAQLAVDRSGIGPETTLLVTGAGGAVGGFAVLEIAASVDTVYHRVHATAAAAMIPHLPPEQRPLVASAALAAITDADVRNPAERAVTLCVLAPHLPDSQRLMALTRAFDAASDIDDPDTRAWPLTTIVQGLSTEPRPAGPRRSPSEPRHSVNLSR